VVVTGLQIVVVVVGTIVVVVVVAPAMVVEDGSEVVVVAGAVVVVGAQVGFFFSVVVVTGLRTGFLGFGRRVVTVSVIVACQRTRVPAAGDCRRTTVHLLSELPGPRVLKNNCTRFMTA